MLKQITEWNTVKKIWMIGEIDLFSQQYRPFLGRWPISGMMRNGVVYELPMQVHPTTGLESSLSPTQVLGTPTTATSGRSPEFRKNSNPNPVEFVEDLLLLRSPKASEGAGGALGEAEALKRGNTVGVRDQVMDLVASQGLKVSRAANNLLPTVIASEGLKASAAQSSEERLKTGQVFLTNIIHDVAVENGLPVPPRLLPTPISSDGKGTGPADANRVTVQLRAINHLLPTVTTQESKSGPSQLNRNTPPLNAILPEMQRLQTNWGKFTPAIERWESLTRKAPAPTKPDGKDGNHRLSAEFTEWMMGLPEGWVTAEDIGLKRNDQLKACGNGVVPQQAELALRILLEGLEFESTIRGGLSSVLPTPTVMDQRDGKYLRTVAIKNLEKGVNRGLNLNNVVEAIGVDWQDGDTFTMTEDGLKKNDN